MTGYCGFSKSNNAIAAEKDGRFPLTAAVPMLARGLKITKAAARKILKESSACEWHHSSKYYNVIKYYDVSGMLSSQEAYDFLVNKLGINFLKVIQKAREEDALKFSAEECADYSKKYPNNSLVVFSNDQRVEAALGISGIDWTAAENYRGQNG